MTKDKTVRVMSVEEGSPAAHSELREGDVIFEFASPIAVVNDGHRHPTTDRMGSWVSVTVVRRIQRVVIESISVEWSP
jgi:S1-C subfamily serine protease